MEIKNIPDSKLATSIYNDAVSPAMKQIGQSAEGLLKFVALPFKFLGLTAEELEKKYAIFIEKAVNQVPAQKLTHPQTSIVAPLLDYVKFSFTDEPGNDLLQEMYSNLLSSAINQDYANKIQKSFVEYMRLLSCNEAKMLEWCFDSIITENAYDAKQNLKIGEAAFMSSFIFREGTKKIVEIPAATPGSFPYLNFPVVESLELLSSIGFIAFEEEYYTGTGFFSDLIDLKAKEMINIEIPTLFDTAIEQAVSHRSKILYPNKKKYPDYLLQFLLESECQQLYNMLNHCKNVSTEQLIEMYCFRANVSVTQYGRNFLDCCMPST